MKRRLYLLFAILLLADCSQDKNADPEPTPAAVAGRYTLTSLQRNGTEVTNLPSLPSTQDGITVSGVVELTPVPGQNDRTQIALTLKAMGQDDIALPLDDIQLQRQDQGYELLTNGQVVGGVHGNTITGQNPQTNEILEFAFTGNK